MISVRVFLNILVLSEKVQTWHTSSNLAEWIKRLTANAKVVTVLGSIPVSYKTLNLRGGR
jgi:hypothetical protein